MEDDLKDDADKVGPELAGGDFESARINDKESTIKFFREIDDEVALSKMKNHNKMIKYKFKPQTERFYKNNGGRPDLGYKEQLDLN
eukprot:CAMPEP_0170550516 /NCGR_PEP_ID=MMETSP0211-20121228/8570_1 /TAXON_ID=311385 /ORGANISM="Pseudokeronopsis sp., Strain OXSARD2" /LENGTH=85 /DNA_ID=CAMNT_0010857109 /DNA_START=928 /DNA_END=1183 /DNA_ORIENTATION=+